MGEATPAAKDLLAFLQVLLYLTGIVATLLGAVVCWRRLFARDRAKDPVTQGEFSRVVRMLRKLAARMTLLRRDLNNGLSHRMQDLENRMDRLEGRDAPPPAKSAEKM